jgi:hypothetical protein
MSRAWATVPTVNPIAASSVGSVSRTAAHTFPAPDSRLCLLSGAGPFRDRAAAVAVSGPIPKFRL